MTLVQTNHPKFEAFVFDLGGVIVAHDNAMMFERLASRCKPRCLREEIEAIVFRPEWEMGEPISALHAEFRHSLGYTHDWATFVDDWCCHFTLDESMLALLQRLNESSKVMLFSNTNKEHWDFVVEMSNGTLGQFERYLSHEIGRAKPSPDAFRFVARSAGIDPSKSVFFDDRHANVEGARLAGFRAEVFSDERWLRSYLHEAGYVAA